MGKITSIDRATCANISKRIAAALAPLAEEFGLSITPGRGSFTATTFSLRLEVATKSTDGQVQSRETQAFAQHAHLFGLNPADLGRKFIASGREFVVSGLNTRARSKPVIATSTSDGRQYKFAAETVVMMLRLAA